MFIGRPLSGVHGQQVSSVADIDSTGLVAYWKLNEGTGTSAASETGNNTGTLAGSATWVTGKTGTGVNMNGTSQYINIATQTGLNMLGTTISIMAWINATTTAGVRRIVCYPKNETNGWEKVSLLLNAGALQFYIGYSIDAARETTTPFTSTGAWNHVCGVYNGTDLRTYINGSLSGTPVAHTTAIQTSTGGNFQIGRFGPTWGQYFSGVVDEVRVYSRAISASEVSTVHSLG